MECKDTNKYCTQCADDTFVKIGSKCWCPDGWQKVKGGVNGVTCEKKSACKPGEFIDKTNICQSCPENCLNCEDITGNCLECEDGWMVNTARECMKVPEGGCKYPIGDQKYPFMCATEWETEDSILGPYPDDAKYIDWRERGVVNPIREQGVCGACWAFNTVAAVETAYAIKHGALYNLSPQHLVDCNTKEDSNSYGNKGCKGGFHTKAWRYYQANEGAILEKDYPYIDG